MNILFAKIEYYFELQICSEILAVLNHSMESSSSSDLLHLSSQTVFSVFDHLTKWSNEKRQEMINASSRAAGNYFVSLVENFGHVFT